MVFLVHWYTIILYLLPSVRCRCLVQSRRPTIANRYFAMRIPTSDQAARRFAGFACFFLLHISGAAVPPVLHMRPPFSPFSNFSTGKASSAQCCHGKPDKD